jgi:integrase
VNEAGEILRLRWIDLDLDEDYIYARSRKQSRRKKETARRIDLHPELKKELLACGNSGPTGSL